MQREFKGVWIPKEIWLNENLGWSEKLLFVEIDSLSKNGECFASNDHFANFLQVSPRQVQNLLASLKDKGYISVDLFYREGTREVDKRVISPRHEINFTTPSRNKVRDPHEQKFATPHEEKFVTPHEEKFVDNNTLIINTDITNTITNTYEKKKKEKKEKMEVRSQLDLEFEQLWTIYPRKQGSKKKAKESYLKARKNDSVTFEKVKFGIDQYIKYINYYNVEEEYIKHATTFFNQECWNNDFTLKPKQIKGYRQGALGLVLNELEHMQYGIVDEESIFHEQNRDSEIFNHATNRLSLPF